MRTDIHAPASEHFDPEAYTCFGVFDNAACEGLLINEAERLAKLAGFALGMYDRHQCGHCGAHLRYCALMIREDVNEYIFVGEDCLANRFVNLTKDEFQKLRKAAALNAEKNKVKNAMAAQIEEFPALAWLTYPQALVNFGTFINDVAAKFKLYGTLSPRQIEFVCKAMETETAKAEAKAAQALVAAEMVALGLEAPNGKATVIGEIVHAEMREGFYGTEYKMLVVTDEGWKFWGTIPKAILADYFGGGIKNFLKGRMVTLTATFTQKDTDPMFAFAARPTNAKLMVLEPA